MDDESLVFNWRLSKNKDKQLETELKVFAVKVKEMNLAKLEAIQCLYEAANYLDKVWRDCRIASAVGNSAGILGGVLTIGGGIATVLTAGAATPLLMAGISLGVAAAGTSLGTAAVETVVKSKQIQKAEKALQIADQLTNKVKRQINEWKEAKNKARLAFLLKLAVGLFGQNHIVVKLIQSSLVSLGINAEIILNILAEAAIKSASKIATKTGMGAAAITAVETATAALFNTASKALVGAVEEGAAGIKAGTNTIGKAGNAGARVASKAAGGVIIGISAVFVAWDAVDLAFNIRNLVTKKGCKAAPYLREKAKELESSLEENITSLTQGDHA